MKKGMAALLKLEELGRFLFAILLFSQMDYAWWIFPACLLLPDLSMVGYIFNPKSGAWLYNLFHHKLVALLVLIIGFWMDDSAVTLAGIILFGHAAMDRIFGYGLKFQDHFNHTHLGRIGKEHKV